MTRGLNTKRHVAVEACDTVVQSMDTWQSMSSATWQSRSSPHGSQHHPTRGRRRQQPRVCPRQTPWQMESAA